MSGMTTGTSFIISVRAALPSSRAGARPPVSTEALDAAALGIPETFNAATYFVDRHRAEGRGAVVAIECGDARVTYDQLLERVNRFGGALRDVLQVRPEERVVLLL